MVAAAFRYHTVAELMRIRAVELDGLVSSTGICPRIVLAIARQQYTPNPDQRNRIARALCIAPERIIWGHVIPAEEFSQIRL